MREALDDSAVVVVVTVVVVVIVHLWQLHSAACVHMRRGLLGIVIVVLWVTQLTPGVAVMHLWKREGKYFFFCCCCFLLLHFLFLCYL